MQNYATVTRKTIVPPVNGDATVKRANLEKFYKGFHSFTKMYVGENFITYMTTSAKMADRAADEAKKRIADLNLPLTVEGGNNRYNTFIVRGAQA